MSVDDIKSLHQRYLRVADRFKSLWTYHQFAKSAYENLVQKRLPYEIDFREAWTPVERTKEALNSARQDEVDVLLNTSNQRIESVSRELLAADAELTPTVMRRFFERLASQDEQLIFNLIKFYIYAGATDGERRDKLDYLLTRIGETHLSDGGEYAARESIALRHQLEAITKLAGSEITLADDVVGTIRELREIKSEVDQANQFEDLTSTGLVDRLRKVKHDSGGLFFHPDVMLAAIHANISMRRKFTHLYELEEEKILTSAERILTNDESIRENLAADPELAGEIDRFKALKNELDKSRSLSNVKHSEVTRIKESLYKIVGEDNEIADAASLEIAEDEDDEELIAAFGEESLLLPDLKRISNGLSPWRDNEGSVESIAKDVVTSLRLERWEIEAFFRLIRGTEEERSKERKRDLLLLRGAALRMRINREAKAMLDLLGGGEPNESGLLAIRAVLKEAEGADGEFAQMIAEMQQKWSSEALRRLHRSRIRLFRDFSGLWLIYDQYISERSNASG